MRIPASNAKMISTIDEKHNVGRIPNDSETKSCKIRIVMYLTIFELGLLEIFRFILKKLPFYFAIKALCQLYTNFLVKSTKKLA
jgi:hypothetical protein